MLTRKRSRQFYMCTNAACKRKLTPTKRPLSHIRQDNWWTSYHAECRFSLCTCTQYSKRPARNTVIKPK